jgi:HSP20 family protein
MSKLERWLPFMFKRKKKNSPDVDTTENEKQSGESDVSPAQGAALARSGPFFDRDLNRLAQGMFRGPWFDDPFFHDPFSMMTEMDRWFGDFSPTRFKPSVEVVDEKDAIKVTAELPGMEKEDLKLHVDHDTLIIEGEKRNESQQEENGVYRTERYYGTVQRAVPLPSDVDHGKAEAAFDKGVLTVRIPKMEKRTDTSRNIPVA